MITYRVFRRSCRNWTEFARARKTTVQRRLVYSQASRMCHEYNIGRTRRQIDKGTMYEMDVELV